MGDSLVLFPPPPPISCALVHDSVGITVATDLLCNVLHGLQTNNTGAWVLGFRGAIKRGGGFLNNVDGELVSYEFTDRFKDEKKAGEWCYFVPTIKVDGADDAVDQHLFLGGNDRYEISEDGQELTMVDESPVSFGFSTPFGRFMDSLIEKGFNESELPDLEDGDALNLEVIVGRRFRFKQEVDVEGTKKKGKRVVGTGKAKKEYDRTNTVIDAVLGAAGKTSTKTTAGKKVKDESGDVEERAEAVLRDVISNEDGETIKRKDLSLPVTKMLMKEKDKKFAAEVKAMVLDEEWQEKQDWLEIDKKGNLSIAA